MRPRLPFVVAVAFASLVPLPAGAQLREVTVTVDGLACPFCAYTLEKNLKKLAGVGSLAIDIHQGTATLSPQPQQPLDLEGIPAAVSNAGFTPRDIRVHARGRIERRDDGARLVNPGGTVLFRLVPNEVLAGVKAAEREPIQVWGVLVAPTVGDDEDAGPPLLALTRTTPAAEAK